MNKSIFAALVVFSSPAFAECPKGQVEQKAGNQTYCIREADVAAFENWVARCQNQSAIRVSRGAPENAVGVVFGKTGKGQPTCHINAAYAAESGAIDE